MMRRTILAIVEGHGEVTALPELLRRIAGEISPDIIVETPRPIRVPRNKLVKQGELERAVAFASHLAGTDGCVLVLLDADRDCPAELAPQLLARAVAASPGRDIRAVLAKAEYEAWFLAAAGSLAGRRGLDQALASPDDPEAIQDAKGWLSARMPLGRRYRETLDQAAFTATFDMAEARRRSPSFDKLWRDVGSLLQPPKT